MKIYAGFYNRAILLLSTAMLVLTGILGIERTKYCFFLIMALSVLKFLHIRMDVRILLLLIAIGASSLVYSFLYGGQLVNWLIFMSSILYAYSLHVDGLEERDWRLLQRCAVVISISFILYHLLAGQRNFAGFIMLYFDNPNMAGIAITAPTVILIISCIYRREQGNTRWRIPLYALIVCNTVLIYLTNNRGSLLTVAAALLCAFCFRRRIPTQRTTNCLKTMLALSPILILFLYVGLMQIIPQDAELLGKPFFSGRELAWQQALAQLLAHPFQKADLSIGTLNVFLEGVHRFGMISTIGFFAFLLSLKADVRGMKHFEYTAYIVFFICLLQQAFESTLITGSYTIYIWMYALLGAAHVKEEERSDDHVLFQRAEPPSKALV